MHQTANPQALEIGAVQPQAFAEFYALCGNAFAMAAVRGVTGFWTLIPIVGFIIWVVKVQGAMNRIYE